MADILKIATPQEISTYLRTINTVPKLGDLLFPNKTVTELKVKNITGADGAPVVAKIHSWNAEAEIGSRDSFSEQELALTFIKKKIPLKEDELMAITNPRTTEELDFLIKNVFNDAKRMKDSVLAKIEAMKMEAAAKGVITITENGITGTIDYKVPSDQKIVLAGSTPADMPWSNAAADILGQLRTYTELMLGKGVKITRALTTSGVISAMLTNTGIKTAINGSANADKMITLADLNLVLEKAELPQFARYDEVYREQNPDGSYTMKKYFPEGYVSLLPDGELGEGNLGPTPEGRKLIKDGKISKMDDVTIYIYESSNDPIETMTKGSASFIPTFPRANEIVSIKVK